MLRHLAGTKISKELPEKATGEMRDQKLRAGSGSSLMSRLSARNNARQGRVIVSGLLRKAITIHSQGKLEEITQTSEHQPLKLDPRDDATGVPADKGRRIPEQIAQPKA